MLEPHEFKMCLISLGYNLKEGEKVGSWFEEEFAEVCYEKPCLSPSKK